MDVEAYAHNHHDLDRSGQGGGGGGIGLYVAAGVCVLGVVALLVWLFVIQKSKLEVPEGVSAQPGVAAKRQAMQPADLSTIAIPDKYKSEYQAVYGSDGRVYAIYKDEKDKVGVLATLVEYNRVMRDKILPLYTGAGKERLVQLFGDKELSHVHQYRENPSYAAYAYTVGDFSFLNINTAEEGGIPGVGGDKTWWAWVFWYSLHEAAHMGLAPRLKHDVEFYRAWSELLRAAQRAGLYDHAKQPKQPPEKWSSGKDWEDWSSNYNGFYSSDQTWVEREFPKIHSVWFGEDQNLYPAGDPRRKA